VHRFGLEKLGRGPTSVLGRKGSRGPFIFFSFFLLFLCCFLISFITFAFDIRIDSNQFLNFSKIQHNVLK
jgi:hypothetical protein